jgi:hypothetical protein
MFSKHCLLFLSPNSTKNHSSLLLGISSVFLLDFIAWAVKTSISKSFTTFFFYTKYYTANPFQLYGITLPAFCTLVCTVWASHAKTHLCLTRSKNLHPVYFTTRSNVNHQFKINHHSPLLLQTPSKPHRTHTTTITYHTTRHMTTQYTNFSAQRWRGDHAKWGSPAFGSPTACSPFQKHYAISCRTFLFHLNNRARWTSVCILPCFMDCRSGLII